MTKDFRNALQKWNNQTWETLRAIDKSGQLEQEDRSYHDNRRARELTKELRDLDTKIEAVAKEFDRNIRSAWIVAITNPDIIAAREKEQKDITDRKDQLQREKKLLWEDLKTIVQMGKVERVNRSYYGEHRKNELIEKGEKYEFTWKEEYHEKRAAFINETWQEMNVQGQLPPQFRLLKKIQEDPEHGNSFLATLEGEWRERI